MTIMTIMPTALLFSAHPAQPLPLLPLVRALPLDLVRLLPLFPAQLGGGGGAGGGNLFLSLVPMLLIFGIFYLLLVMPMRKRQKALQQLLENLKKGDRVVTSGGLYGEIAAINGPTILLKIADNVRVKVARSAISGLEGESDETTGSKS
jgi:preprotein translocase subunit YajC